MMAVGGTRAERMDPVDVAWLLPVISAQCC